jgi:hypothetical protein
MRMITSATSKTRNALMLLEAKTRKVKQSKSMVEQTTPTKDGRSSIKTKLKRFQPRDSTRSSDSRSTDHSTLFQIWESTELLNVSEPTTWSSRDTPRVDWVNNSISTVSQEPSDPSNGRTMLLKSNPMEAQLT